MLVKTRVFDTVIPVLDENKPAFGIVPGGEEVTVILCPSLPSALIPLLDVHIEVVLKMETKNIEHLLWSVVKDFFNLQVHSGNLRRDVVSKTWYWFGPSDSKEDKS